VENGEEPESLEMIERAKNLAAKLAQVLAYVKSLPLAGM
jgi:hypothetical protein